MKRSLAAVLLVAGTVAALAAPPWIDTPASRAFRQRVIDLALLYETSSGLDGNGFLIQATVRPGEPGPCKTVDVRITLGGEAAGTDTVQVCPKP